MRPAETAEVMDVAFPDGRPFHRMGFTGQSNQDVHWCDPDTYRVRYTARGPDEACYRWDVTGPAKDQLLESVLRRLDPRTGTGTRRRTLGWQGESPHRRLRRLRLR